MANLNIHPAPGLGDLLAGYYVVPQNPIQMAQEGVSRVTTLGELMDGSFVVPQNPLRAYITGNVQPIGQGAAGTPMMKRKGKKSMSGLGCGGSGDCGCHTCSRPDVGSDGGLYPLNGLGGLGDISTDWTIFSTDLTNGNFMTALTDPILGVPSMVWLVGLIYLFWPSGGESRAGRLRKRYA